MEIYRDKIEKAINQKDSLFIESFYDSGEIDIFSISPNKTSVDRNEFFDSILTNPDDFNVYIVSTLKNRIFPIRINSEKDLISALKITDIKFIQIAFRRVYETGKSRTQDIDRYSMYLKGLDNPSKYKAILNIQMNILNIANKLSGYKLSTYEDVNIEDKILSEKFLFRIIVVSKNKNIQREINYFNYYNSLVANQVNKVIKRKIINNTKNLKHTFNSNNILSIDEVCGLMGLNSINNENTLTNKETHGDVKLPIPKYKDTQDDTIPNNVIVDALYKSGAIKNKNIKMTDTEFGSTMQKYTFTIPDNVNFTDISKRDIDIGAKLGEDVNIVKGDSANTFMILMPRKSREIIFLSEVINNECIGNKKLPIICGVGLNNNVIVKCLTEAPHLLICGATGSGKSVFLNSLITTLILKKTKDELRMILIDPKKVELANFNNSPHIDELITDMDRAEKSLINLLELMEDRYNLFLKNSSRNIDDYNESSKEKMPYVVCVIEEYNDLRLSYPEVEDHLKKLSQKSRACGIHLILTTQRPDKEVMNGVIKTNFPSRISFRLEGSNEYRTVFGRGIPYKTLLGKGDGVVRYLGQTEDFIRFQSPIISDNKKEETSFFNSLSKSNLSKLNVESDLEKMKRVISETGETRVKELQKIMKIRINDVASIRKKLVEEGFLVQKGNKTLLNDKYD